MLLELAKNGKEVDPGLVGGGSLEEVREVDFAKRIRSDGVRRRTLVTLIDARCPVGC